MKITEFLKCTLAWPALLLCGCSSANTPPDTPVQISVAPNPVAVSGEGGTAELTVTADAEWGIYLSEADGSQPSWASIAPNGGLTGTTDVRLTIQPNPSQSETRTADIVVKSGTARFRVPLTQAAAPYVAPPAMFVPEGYTLLWSDEFDGDTLDAANWSCETGAGGWGNAEMEFYTGRPENVRVENGNLIITARKESYNGAPATSARLITQNKVTFQYGYIVAAIKLPKTANGLWPAFWMMGNDFSTAGWPACGETDIMEMGNTEGIAAGTQERLFGGACHWGGDWAQAPVNSYSLQDGNYHTFTCIWDQTAIRMYVDLEEHPAEQPYFTMAITDNMGGANAFRKENFILFNLAVGGNYTGIWNIDGITALASGSAEMQVDYVRVFQKK